MTHKPSYRILGIGAACVDLLIPISEDFLRHVPGKKGGAQAISIEEFNHILAQSHIPPSIAAGGSCANAIKGLANLGETCALFSHIGSDAFGEHLAHYMAELGIVELFSKSPLPTQRVLCLITPDGQRTMRFCTGCIDEMSESFLSPAYFEGIQLAHLDAYTLRNGNLTRQAMRFAKQAGAMVSLDLSSFEVIRDYHAPLMELLSNYVDIVFANRDEVKALLGLNPIESCLKLQEICSIAVVLLGNEGCLVGHQGQFFHCPAFPAKLVDSTGAGDLFGSGFLYGYLQGYPLTHCATLGNRLGGAVIEMQGADIPPEKWEVIKSFIRTL